MHFFEHTKTNKHKIENGKLIESLEEEKINQNGNILIRGIKDGVPFMFSNLPELKHLRPNGLVLNNNQTKSKASRKKTTKRSKSKPKKPKKPKKSKKSKKPKKVRKVKTPMKK
jgi:hypothetical protein